MSPARLTDADYRELALRWVGTPHLAAHMIWQARTRTAQGTAPMPAAAPAPQPVPAPVQWNLFD